jgi:hypothetical protein
MIERFSPRGQVPPYAIAEKSDLAIGWDGAPLLYRANGKTGRFAIGSYEAAEAAIYIHLLDWRWIEESRWGGEVEHWLDVLFLNGEQQVSLLPLRSNAATRFSAWLKGLQSNPRQDYIAHSVWLRMELLTATVVVNDREESIFLPEVIDFGWVDGARFDAASRWLERFDPDVNANCWIIPGDIQPA